MKNTFIALIALFAFACGSKNHDANIAVVKQYVEAVENLDYAAMENLLTDNYQGYGPSAGDTISREAAIENWKLNVADLYQKIEFFS